MIIISSREFRENQKKYLDMVDDNKQIVIRRGKDKAYMLNSISDADKLSVDPELIKAHLEALKEFEEGKTTHIKDPKNIWESIL
ncbi:MAG: type II toxin-antitoxin system Phd/YefM family antitoxin [Salinivirgaceae bacterium]|nr:type II toxin-antitoxin system Phd/YefM family antitoxin [Salinivirgaceae bacterium]MDY0281568.1 type II toxin-antitoxin system Phd/YefM family antitoxin [Salinivirgaceae bacterium]